MNIFRKIFGDWEKKLEEIVKSRLLNGRYVVTNEYQEILPNCWGLTPKEAKRNAELELETPWDTLQHRGCCVAKISLEYVEGFRSKNSKK